MTRPAGLDLRVVLVPGCGHSPGGQPIVVGFGLREACTACGTTHFCAACRGRRGVSEGTHGHPAQRAALPHAHGFPCLVVAAQNASRGADDQGTGNAPRWTRWLWHPGYLKAIACTTLAALLVHSTFGLVRDESRVARALWQLEGNHRVLGHMNLFQTYDDDAHGQLPSPSHGYRRVFLKPPHITYPHTRDADLREGCARWPDAVVLLTNDISTDALPDRTLDVDRAYAHVLERFAPVPLHLDLPLHQRMWRFALVECETYLDESPQ